MMILMMAAGAGSRFGDGLPKPFRKVDRSREMWRYVAEKMGFDNIDVFRALVLQQSHMQHLAADTSRYFDKVIYIPSMVAAGPAWSVVAASLEATDDQELLVVDCDSFVHPYGSNDQLVQMLTARMRRDTDVVVFGVRNDGDEDKNVSRIEYYSSVTPTYPIRSVIEGGAKNGDFMNVGAYYFRTIRSFRNAVAEILPIKEVKLSDVVNRMTECSDGEMIELDGEFINLGTPELLAAYQKERGYA